MKLRDYATAQGIAFLDDDLKFIKRLTGRMHTNDRAHLVKRYIDLWVIAMQNCPCEIKQQNAGRYAANTFLREICKTE